MRISTAFLYVPILAAGLFLFLTCQEVSNPFDPSEAKISLILKTPDNRTSDSTITDTVGTTDSIGLVLYLAQYIDSVEIAVHKGNTLEYMFVCKTRAKQIDTVFYAVSFASEGDRIITATGYVKGQLNPYASATIHVVGRPAENHPPVLTVTGTKLIVAGETVTLHVSAFDPDQGQTVTTEAPRIPDGAVFSNDTLSWPTSLADVGTDTAVFIARDNGTPVMTDIDTVIITISATPINRPPEWNPKTIQRSGQPGSAITLLLTAICSDPDGDDLTFTLLSGSPDGDTIMDSIWSFTPAENDTGNFTAKVVVHDPEDASDTLTIALTVTTEDRTPPSMKRLTPLNDSISVSSSSYQVALSCKDPSGIASVKCSMGTDTFPVISSDTLYSATVTGLKPSVFNAIRFIATDASPRSNQDSLFIHLRFDSTITDTDSTGPIIKKITPAKDSVSTNASSYTVTLSCIDTSGVLSVIGTMGSQSFTGTRGSDTTWTIPVSGLAVNTVNTVVFNATDSSLRANKSSLTLYIIYDPTMDDVDGPTIKQISGPASGSVIKDPVIAIIDSIVDPSGLDSVYWTLNGVWAGTLTTVSGSPNGYQLRDTLTTYHDNRIVVHAIDNATRHNRDSAVVLLDFNVPPVIGDTSISTDKNKNITITLVALSSDGDPIAWTKISDPAHGTVTGTLPAMTYAPSNNYVGTDSFFVQVSDGVWSDTGKIRVSVRDVNFPPVVKDSTITINEDVPVTFNLSGTDPDGDALSGWVILKQGSNGIAALATSPANRVTYTPSSNFAGKDTFSFRAGDGSLYDTGFIWITITPVNDTPSISRNLGLTVLEGGSGTVNTSRLDFSDPDNPATDLIITFSAIPQNGQLKLSSIPVVVSGTMTYGELSSNALQYTHNGLETVADSFSFSVSDGQLARTGKFKFTVSAVNDTPTLSKTGNQMKNSIGIGNYYRDTVTVSDPEGAYSSMSVSMAPSDAGITYTTSNGRIAINWCIDLNKYSVNQAVPCTLKVVDGAITTSIRWTTIVGKHVWTKIFNGGDLESYLSSPTQGFTARDSFTIFTSIGVAFSGTAALYRCALGATPSWSQIGTVPVGFGITTLLCNGSRLVAGDGMSGYIYSYNAVTGAKTTDSARGLGYWSDVFLSDTGRYFYTILSQSGMGLDSNYLIQNATKVYTRDTSGGRAMCYGAASTTHIFFSTSRVTGSGTVLGTIARLTMPLPNTASYFECPTTLHNTSYIDIHTDKNNADTIYTFGDGGLTRIVNFPTSTTPGIQTLTVSPVPTKIANTFSGSVGWYISSNILYFTRDGFVSATSENFDAGFVPAMVVISGDKKSIFVIGSDMTIFRY